ncbi:MAG: tetratricopeptide repeat protein [Candidatus Mariimomonas ferrooxydans]
MYYQPDFSFIFGCTIFKENQKKRSANYHLIRSQKLLAGGDYEKALEENRKVLSLYDKIPAGDAALFNTGLIYAHDGNPGKDYKKSLGFFKKLIKEFPQSPLVEQAKIWVSVLDIIEKSKQVDIEIGKKKKEARED